MQRVRLLRRFVNTSMLVEKAVLRRNVFTIEGPGKGNGVPCVTTIDREQDEKLLQPLAHLLQVPGKLSARKFNQAYNYWLKVPADKIMVVKDIIHMLFNSNVLIDDIQDNTDTRRGIPVAHSVYGVPSTIIAANYLLLKGLNQVQNLNHPEALTACLEPLLDSYYGQGLEIVWRENYTCPSFEEYKHMVQKKSGGYMYIEVALMQSLSDNKIDLTKLNNTLSLYMQFRNDYLNLCLPEYAKEKGYCEDLTEGKFSFPIIHAILSHPDDHRVINILRQRTRDVELKKHCVNLLEEFGSFSYTRSTLAELDAEVRAEVARLGGNSQFEEVLDGLPY